MNDTPIPVAINLPQGKELVTPMIISDSEDGCLTLIRKHPSLPGQTEVVPCYSIGLEWQINGNRAKWSNHYRAGKFCAIYTT